MIFVTVGTHNQGFPRLIKKMDEIAPRIGDEVVMQIGHTKYVPRNSAYFTFTSYEGMTELIKKARVVVTHGASTIISALELGKPVIAVPRLKKYKEHINDHQLELCQELEKQGRVMAVYNVEDLEKALTCPEMRIPAVEGNSRLIHALHSFLADFERELKN